MNALAFVARQVLRREIDMSPLDCQPLLGIALGPNRECDLARPAVASAYAPEVRRRVAQLSARLDADSPIRVPPAQSVTLSATMR